MKPLVSIITGVFNNRNTLGECYRSVINQTYDNFEWIIIDDQSTDDSADIILKWQDDRIKLYHTPYNTRGPASPRNMGVENAKGDLIALLDADDLWDSDKLQRQLDFMERDTDIVFLSSNLRLVDDINRKIEDCIRKRRIVYPKASDIYRENPFLSSSIIAKRSVVEDVGGFDESHELLGRDEWDLAIRVSLKYKAAFDGKHIAGTYRWHEGNLSHDILSPLSSMEYLRDKYDQYFPPSLIRDVRARDCYNVAKNALRMGELKVFEEHIKKASRYRGYYRWKGAFIRCKNLFSNIYQ